MRNSPAPPNNPKRSIAPHAAAPDTRPELSPAALKFCRREVWWEPLPETDAVARELASLLPTLPRDEAF
jgi:hypothetical protein